MVRTIATSSDAVEDDSYLSDSVFTLSTWGRGRETDTDIDGFSQEGETLGSDFAYEGDLMSECQDSIDPRQFDETSKHDGVHHGGSSLADIEDGQRRRMDGKELQTELDFFPTASASEPPAIASSAIRRQHPPSNAMEPKGTHLSSTPEAMNHCPGKILSSSCTLCTSMTNGTSGTGALVTADARKATLSAADTATSDSSTASRRSGLDRATHFVPTALPRIKCVLLLVTSFVLIIVLFVTVGGTWFKQSEHFERWDSRPSMAPIPLSIAYGPTEAHVDTGSEDGTEFTPGPTNSPTASPTLNDVTPHPSHSITTNVTVSPTKAPSSQRPPEAPVVSPVDSEVTASPSDRANWDESTLHPTGASRTKPSYPPMSIAPTPQATSPPTRTPIAYPLATERPTARIETDAPATSTTQTPTPRPTRAITTSTELPAEIPSRISTMVPTASVNHSVVALDARATNLVAVLQSVNPSPSHLGYPNTGDSPEDMALTWLVEHDPARLDGSNIVRVRQRYALATLWFSTATKSTWTNAEGWLTGLHECLWYGVSVCENGQIHTIRMASNGLSGKLPDNLGLLTELEMLYLQDNALSGTIPTVLALCTDLLALQLAGNSLSGSIPQELSRLNNIRYVQLKNNKLSGSLTSELSGWKKLEILSLGQNNLSGTIPAEFAAWTSLGKIRLTNNNFSGSIPSFSQWNQLTEFSVQHNDFTGSLPATIGIQWPNIELFHAGQNRWLTGILPVSYSNWLHLIAFSAPKSSLTGTLPVEYAKWANIKSFDVGDNRLVGSLPRLYGAWQHLRHFRVSDNALTGPIPETFSSWTGLEEFAVARNQLEGTLAASFGAWTKLKAFAAPGNQLNGMVPETASSWTELVHFDVSQNALTGILPQGVVFWTSIRSAQLQGNNIGGLVPFCIFGYDVETLIADCDKATCTCCTKCCVSTEAGSVCTQT